MFCCENCFADKEIINFIKSNNTLGDCDYCGSKNVKVSRLKDAGNFIRKGFKRAYEHVEGLTGAMWDGEEHQYIGRDGNEAGESLLDILYWNECIFSNSFSEDKAGTLLEELMSESGLSYSDMRDGCFDECDDIRADCFVRKYDLYGHEVTAEYTAWQSFKYTCKHYNRYFDIGSKANHREKLLNTLEIVFKSMRTVLKSDTLLLRARKFTLDKGIKISDINAYKETAPAPIYSAKNSRMSPAGISYTYLADNIITCFSEIRTNPEDMVLIGEFKTKKELTILDLSVKPKIRIKSIFSSSYNHDMNWIGDFINSFRSEISKPISDDDKDLEYVPTQVLAEYIRKLGYDGIRFESSLISGTHNYVLFCGPNPDHCQDDYKYEYSAYKSNELIYFTEWINLEKVEYKKITTTSFESDLLESFSNIKEEKKEYFPQIISIEEVENAFDF